MYTRTLILFFTVLLYGSHSVFAQEQEQGSWIVLGSDASINFSTILAQQPELGSELVQGFQVGAEGNGRSAARIAPQLTELLTQSVHDDFHRCGGYTIHPTLEQALQEVNNPFYTESYLNRSVALPTVLNQEEYVEPALANVDKDRILNTIKWLEEKGTRYYDSDAGREAALELKTQWEGYGVGRSDFSVSTFSHPWKQPSIIATIKGAEHPEEIIIVGGHLDSINGPDPTKAPGADDNGSGIAVVTEILRVLLSSEFRPKRTLQFMAYAAEEVGLRGSKAIAQSYTDSAKKVLAALQFDMTGFQGSPKDMYFITDYVSSDVTKYLKRLISQYNSSGAHTITYGETSCGYACSDHASWTAQGVAAGFPFESLFGDYNRNIHTPNDLLTNIDETGTRQMKFAKLGIEFMMETSKNVGSVPSAVSRRHGFAWANKANVSSYTPATQYAFNSSGGTVTAYRSGVGRYSMVFAGLGGNGSAGAQIQLTSYGLSTNQCKISSWQSSGADLRANVRCFNSTGVLVNELYSIYVTWP